MKRLLIMLVVFLLFVVGLLYGAGLVNFFEEEVKAIEKVDEELDILKGDHTYIRLRPFTVTVFRNDNPVGTFSASLVLEIAAEGVRDEYTQRQDRLRDIMFREIHAMVEREQITGRVIDVDQLKQRMRAIVVAELSEEVVVDIYVNAILRNGA